MINLYTVSTFTTDFFGGNPAAVCLLEADDRREEHWYSRVAALLAQPATAFCQPVPGGFALRWFSPSHELTLCGHGTLATAHVLYETGVVPPGEEVLLRTMTADLHVRRTDGRSWMSLPAVDLVDGEPPADLLEALGVPAARGCGRGSDELVVELDSVEDVVKVRPNFGLLAGFPVTRTVVTAAGGDGVDFTSRVFPPRIGIDEDQVTGSAHAALGPYWAPRLGRSLLTARQASARGGELSLDVSVLGVVEVGGQAVTTSRGVLLL